MANYLQRASQTLRKLLLRHVPRPILYERPGEGAVSLAAAAGDRLFDVAGSEDGLLTKIRLRDYLIDRPLLRLNDQPVEPREGDLIHETIEGRSLTFMVTPLGDSEPGWRWADADGQLLRVHTKQVTL